MFIRRLLRSYGGARSGFTRCVESFVGKDKPFSDLQGQTPGFIGAYTKLNAGTPSQAAMRRHFTVITPVLCRMVGALEKERFILRQARQAFRHPFRLAIIPNRDPSRRLRIQ